MFKNCYSLTSIILSSLDVSNAITLSSMFESSGLTSLDLTHFDTSKVTDMSNMFNNCTSLRNLKVNFNTKLVTKMPNMFGSCTQLTSLDISMFDTTTCYMFSGIFENDKALELTVNYNVSKNLKDNVPEYVKVHDISAEQNKI